MLFYAYFFTNPDPDTQVPYVIYAYSEKHARRRFKARFDVDAGPLIERQTW